MLRNLLILTLGLLIVFVSDPALAKKKKNAEHLKDLSCAVNEIAKFNGIKWKCSLDEDTGDTLGDLSCDTSQIAEYDEPNNQWVCANKGGSGIPVLAGQECPAGEAIVGFDADINIICAIPTADCTNIAPGANLTSCEFGNAILNGDDLTGATLVNVDLAGATLDGTIMINANLTGASLGKA